MKLRVCLICHKPILKRENTKYINAHRFCLNPVLRAEEFMLDRIQEHNAKFNVYKLCYICKEEKPVRLFHRHSEHLDGLTQQCKECTPIVTIQLLMHWSRHYRY